MPRILALDTSTEACSVALYVDGEVHEDHRVLPREHTRYLLPMVDSLLTSHKLPLRDLDAIAFGCGPGSFTGLRVCIGVVQGLAFGTGVPVVPVSTLHALAQSALSAAIPSAGCNGILAALDARMDEVYWATFGIDENGLHRFGDEILSAPEKIALPAEALHGKWLGAGSGWRYRERIACATDLEAIDETALPRAAAVARLAVSELEAGRAVSPEKALPTYLRDEVAWR